MFSPTHLYIDIKKHIYTACATIKNVFYPWLHMWILWHWSHMTTRGGTTDDVVLGSIHSTKSTTSCLSNCLIFLTEDWKDAERTADLWYNLWAAKSFLLRNLLRFVLLTDHQPCGEVINSDLHTPVTWQATNLCQSLQGHLSWLGWQPLLFNPPIFSISVNIAERLGQ